MSLVITGTDTGIGKTIVSALLLIRFRQLAPSYWKPVATGTDSETDAGAVRRLCGDTAAILPETYLLQDPVSPHLAARREFRRISPDKILKQFERYRDSTQDCLLIEGIGGLLVPLTASGYLLADLWVEMKTPCLLVASSRVGTINHTLLTIEAMRNRGLQLAGVVLNGVIDRENSNAIEKFGQAAVIDIVQPIRPLSAPNLNKSAERFDMAGRLEGYLTRISHTSEKES